MRVAFYAPMKPPDHPVPSGDRRMARALIEALQVGGHTVELIARFRSYDRDGILDRQVRLRTLGARLAERLARRLERRPPEQRPEAWLSYHVYHKSPDHLGPRLSRLFGIPYLIAEASIAAKRARGAWAEGYADAWQAIEAADLVLAMTRIDRVALNDVVGPPRTLVDLPPFMDPEPFRRAVERRAAHRRALARAHDLDPTLPWLLAVAMMRADAKLCSYRRLAAALARLDRPCQLVVAGDGPARRAVEAAFAGARQPVRFLGLVPLNGLARAAAAADLFVWPAVREAYGLAMLEAGAAGLPVIAGREGGVEDVVRDGVTGLLVEPDDSAAFAGAIRTLLDDPERRRAMGAAAARIVSVERSLERASAILTDALGQAASIRHRRASPPGLTG